MRCEGLLVPYSTHMVVNILLSWPTMNAIDVGWCSARGTTLFCFWLDADFLHVTRFWKPIVSSCSAWNVPCHRWNIVRGDVYKKMGNDVAPITILCSTWSSWVEVMLVLKLALLQLGWEQRLFSSLIKKRQLVSPRIMPDWYDGMINI